MYICIYLYTYIYIYIYRERDIDFSRKLRLKREGNMGRGGLGRLGLIRGVRGGSGRGKNTRNKELKEIPEYEEIWDQGYAAGFRAGQNSCICLPLPFIIPPIVPWQFAARAMLATIDECNETEPAMAGDTGSSSSADGGASLPAPPSLAHPLRIPLGKKVWGGWMRGGRGWRGRGFGLV